MLGADSNELLLKTRNQAMDTKSRITSFGHRNVNRRRRVTTDVRRLKPFRSLAWSGFSVFERTDSSLLGAMLY